MQAVASQKRFSIKEEQQIVSIILSEADKMAWLENYELDALFRNRTMSFSKSDITLDVENVLDRIFSIGINVPQPNAIRDYLIWHPDLTELILHVCKFVSERMGARAYLSLELYRDQEIEDEYPTLYIRQESYDKNIMEVIKEIRAEYEEDISGKPGWFIVTTDFKAPPNP